MNLKQLILKDIITLTQKGAKTVTAAAVSRLLKRANPSVRRAMNQMADAGILDRLGEGQYRIAKRKLQPQPETPATPVPAMPVQEGEILPDPENPSLEDQPLPEDPTAGDPPAEPMFPAPGDDAPFEGDDEADLSDDADEDN